MLMPFSCEPSGQRCRVRRPKHGMFTVKCASANCAIVWFWLACQQKGLVWVGSRCSQYLITPLSPTTVGRGQVWLRPAFKFQCPFRQQQLFFLVCILQNRLRTYIVLISSSRPPPKNYRTRPKMCVEEALRAGNPESTVKERDCPSKILVGMYPHSSSMSPTSESTDSDLLRKNLPRHLDARSENGDVWSSSRNTYSSSQAW